MYAEERQQAIADLLTQRGRLSVTELGNEEMNPLFQATVEATEEAIYNALFMATTVTSNGTRVEAIPIDEVKRILARRGVIR